MRAALLVAALGAAAVGCAEPTEPAQCDGIIDVGCDGGLPGASLDDAGASWASSPWAGPHFSYAKYTTYRVCHGLGRAPASVEVWAAFAPSGASIAKQIGSAAVVIPSCGNQPGVTDRSVLLRNGGGQDFFARVVLRP